jgi:hypothetical protein
MLKVAIPPLTEFFIEPPVSSWHNSRADKQEDKSGRCADASEPATGFAMSPLILPGPLVRTVVYA